MHYRVNDPPAVQALCDLRESVGWSRSEVDYPVAFEGYTTMVAAYDGHEALVGWCAVVSDGVRHAFLVDVIVHPNYQRQGMGRRLVNDAIADAVRTGVSIIHVDFEQENAVFYEHCGFRMGLAGIREVRSS